MRGLGSGKYLSRRVLFGRRSRGRGRGYGIGMGTGTGPFIEEVDVSEWSVGGGVGGGEEEDIEEYMNVYDVLELFVQNTTGVGTGVGSGSFRVRKLKLVCEKSSLQGIRALRLLQATWNDASNVEEVHFGQNQLRFGMDNPSRPEESLPLTFEALRHNRLLRVLDLRSNCIGPRASELIQALSTNQNLQILNLSWNVLPNSVFQVVSETFRRNSNRIEELYLGFNRLTSEKVLERLFEMLGLNTVLKVFDIGGNPVGCGTDAGTAGSSGGSVMRTLRDALARNRSLETLKLSLTDGTADGGPIAGGAVVLPGAGSASSGVGVGGGGGGGDILSRVFPDGENPSLAKIVVVGSGAESPDMLSTTTFLREQKGGAPESDRVAEFRRRMILAGDKLRKMQQQYDQRVEDLRVSAHSVEKLQADLDRMRVTLESKDAELQSARRQRENLVEKVRVDAGDERRRLLENLSRLRNDNEALSKERFMLRATVAKNTDDLEDQSQKMANLRQQLKTDRAELDREKLGLESAALEYNRKIEQQEREMDYLKGKLTASERDVDSKQREIEAVRQSLADQYRRALQEKNQKIETLQDELSRASAGTRQVSDIQTRLREEEAKNQRLLEGIGKIREEFDLALDSVRKKSEMGRREVLSKVNTSLSDYWDRMKTFIGELPNQTQESERMLQAAVQNEAEALSADLRRMRDDFGSTQRSLRELERKAEIVSATAAQSAQDAVASNERVMRNLEGKVFGVVDREIEQSKKEISSLKIKVRDMLDGYLKKLDRQMEEYQRAKTDVDRRAVDDLESRQRRELLDFRDGLDKRLVKQQEMLERMSEETKWSDQEGIRLRVEHEASTHDAVKQFRAEFNSHVRKLEEKIQEEVEKLFVKQQDHFRDLNDAQHRTARRLENFERTVEDVARPRVRESRTERIVRRQPPSPMHDDSRLLDSSLLSQEAPPTVEISRSVPRSSRRPGRDVGEIDSRLHYLTERVGNLEHFFKKDQESSIEALENLLGGPRPRPSRYSRAQKSSRVF